MYRKIQQFVHQTSYICSNVPYNQSFVWCSDQNCLTSQHAVLSVFLILTLQYAIKEAPVNQK
jgi:hypothetical protein